MKYTTREQQYQANQQQRVERKLVLNKARELYADWEKVEDADAAASAEKDFKDFMNLFQLSLYDIRDVLG